ncbi:MAG: beta-ketoacyl-ACP synthase II [Spirochaetes bacterium]|nr:beta-ketoacyl-ACP synthase II [Spirochaetota bacterium]MBP8991825.1 beta-ketoacyl-ACP synthase II [Spirochaetota bacterium]NLJ04418.1 beta-ketoacyl-ACP synthase II [Exilispira sp.]HOV46750.1 beta-ketoacyl-ACP synthase II [Exilispira sp.]HQM89648.1 beta-ketoacyl-ACP synthase II [Exilispira sp.]
MRRRVVVTGIGLINCLGKSVQEQWENLIKGTSGISRLTDPEFEKIDVRIGGKISNFDPSRILSPRDLRQYDLYTQYALYCTDEAVRDSRIFDSNDIKKDRFGVIFSSGIGGIISNLEAHKGYIANGQKEISLYTIPKMIANIAAGVICLKYGLYGLSYSIVSACASSAHAVGEATRKIQYDELDYVIAGGAEASLIPFALGAFSNMKAVSKNNENPQKASRPYDSSRDGFVMSEGAGALVLEEYEAAKKRGAKIYAEIIGYGSSSDAYHLTAPHPEGLGAALCMNNAIKDACIDAEKISYINAHGTSTPVGDIAETKAIKACFKDHAKDIAISSNKSMIGHLLGAAGAVELINTILTVNAGIIPPTINLDNQDPECDLFYVPNKAIEKKVDYALSNSFGFGGQNASIIIKKGISD